MSKSTALQIAFGLALAVGVQSTAMAFQCTIEPTPVSVGNRCPTPREYSGEVDVQTTKVNKQSYSTISGLETYQLIFSESCTDSCGNAFETLVNVYWDCVGAQPIIGLQTAFSQDDLKSDRMTNLCQGEVAQMANSTSDKVQIKKFLTEQFGAKMHPSDMPESQKGIQFDEGNLVP